MAENYLVLKPDSVFMHFQESLTELEELKRLVPKESLVYFLIGKVQL